MSLWSTPLHAGTALVGLALLLLALLLGVAIGNSGDQPRPVVAAASKPQVITVAASGPATSAANTTFTSDWPGGKQGYTIQLKALPKDGSQVSGVDTAKTEVEGKGAKNVGALDSDNFSSLDPGNYLIYSGIFDNRAQAAKELKKLKKDFPAAKVIRVSTGAGSSKGAKKVSKGTLKSLQNLSPQDYQKKSKKLPDKLKLPGKPPPKDTKKPGGGSGAKTIG
jgi:SPOR domain